LINDPIVIQLRESQVIILSIWFGVTAFDYWIFSREWSGEKEKPEPIAKISIAVLLLTMMPLATIAILGHLAFRWLQSIDRRVKASRKVNDH
jgi:hypothetical protein